MNKFYVTNSIVYINARPHIGYAQELLAADVIARFNRKKGKDVFFLTGTDEHGVKILRTAKEAGQRPDEWAEQIVAQYVDLTRDLNISNDDFIRTTSERHFKLAQDFWKKCKNDLYKKNYKAFYCVGCEAFLTKSDLSEGKCPIHGKEPEEIEEENYFFKLFNYSDQILKLLEENPEFVRPASRYNEILSFIKSGLQDVSISRPKEKLEGWGIPVPGDDSQLMYVWFDALTNYLHPKDFWPADLHIVGKDILRFHAVLWPAMLMSAGFELPKQIFAHGFISVDGKKMSKSLSNVISPDELIEKFGVDGARYILLRGLSFDQDSDFSWEKAIARFNADLANDLGNLVMRVVTLAQKLKTESEKGKNKIKNSKIDDLIEELNFSQALEEIWRDVKAMNVEIDKIKLWELVKSDPTKAQEVIQDYLNRIFIVAEQIEPFMPEISKKIKKQLETKKTEVLFPKINSQTRINHEFKAE